MELTIGKRIYMENKFIIKDDSLIEFYQSLGMSGFWKMSHISFLKAVIHYLSFMNISINEKEIAKIVCDDIKNTIPKLMKYEYTRDLLKLHFMPAIRTNNWVEIQAQVDELQIKMWRTFK